MFKTYEALYLDGFFSASMQCQIKLQRKAGPFTFLENRWCIKHALGSVALKVGISYGRSIVGLSHYSQQKVTKIDIFM